jgi:hypothetical protein
MSGWIQAGKIIWIAGVGERIKVGHEAVWGFVEEQSDEVRANKAGPAGYKNRSHLCDFL